MLRVPFSRACLAVLFAVIPLAGPARAQSAASPGGVHDMALPGGFQQVLATSGEGATLDRSEFLVDFIRRTHNRPPGPKQADLDALQSLPGGNGGSNGLAAPGDETLPLPLPAATWIDTVFGGRETRETLLGAIMRSRGPALLYYGLLSLDEDTRTWLVTHPQLIKELADQRSAAFVVAAPGLRVREGAIAVPSGEAAAPAWEALVGHRVGDPAGFTRALLAQEGGRLAFFFGTMAQLAPGQLRVALSLDSPDAAVRVAAVRRLRAVFERVTPGWRVHDSVFWRPALDPALLVASLRRDSAGLPVVPGNRQFWTAVFAQSPTITRSVDRANHVRSGGNAIDFAWLCEQIFRGHQADDHRRYSAVLLVSRLEARSARWSAPEAIGAVRAARSFPALIGSLERANLVDVAAFSAAVRRAERMAAMRDHARATRALAQFQGALALVTRAASRHGTQPEALATVIVSLSNVELSHQGDYEGRLVRWLTGWLAAHLRDTSALEPDVTAAASMERDALTALAGPEDVAPRLVDWEGTTYRLDFASAEGVRIARLLGEQSRPFLSSARALVAMADEIGRGGLTAERLRQHTGALEEIALAVAWDDADQWKGTGVGRRYRSVSAALQRAARTEDVQITPLITSGLLALADDLLARGLMELAYAVALGQPDRAFVSADEAARRHDFAPKGGRRPSAAWELPVYGVALGRGWYVTGSVLGLDVRLADRALLRLSSKPLPKKPTLADDHRRVFIETIALVDAASLTDEDRATIVSALRNGRARLAAARTPADVIALAEEIRLSPARRTLLSWAIAQHREGVETFLSLGELLWLGLERAPVSGSLHAWGVPAWPRTGCLCLEVLDREPWEALAGRWHSGALSSGFPDLNLRLAELLDELGMPASLQAPVLAAATLDLVDTAAARDADDRRALLDFVQSLRLERVEQYLALLTTDGPLVPVGSGGAR